jgi:hypothetical protein
MVKGLYWVDDIGDRAMAKKGSRLFTGAMGDWEPVTGRAPNPADSGDRPLSKPDRVAKEQRVLVDKYLGNAAPKTAKKVGNPHVDSTVKHSQLVRAKKKGALDDDTNAKTFVVSGNKIVGSQG